MQADADLFAHHIEIVSVKECDAPPLTDHEVRRKIEEWCEENEAVFALGRRDIVFFAHECDALMFYLRFA